MYVGTNHLRVLKEYVDEGYYTEVHIVNNKIVLEINDNIVFEAEMENYKKALELADLLNFLETGGKPYLSEIEVL